MMRPRLSVSCSFALISVLLGSLSACGADSPSQPMGGAGTPGLAGAPGTAGGPSTNGGSPSTNGGGPSTNGGSPSTNGGGPTAGGGAAGSANGGSGSAAAGSSNASAGTAGSVAQAGAAGTGSAGAPGNAILSADFESDEVGKQPAGWHNFLAYNTDAMNPQGDIQAIVDATRPHGGKNSLHVKGGQSPAFLTRALPTDIKKLYVRGYFYMTRQLGQNPGANHETLFGIRQNKDNEIRFGEIKGVIGVNEVPSDNITPKMDLWGKGPLIAASKWACIEAAFIGDQAQHEFHAWADGTEVISVTKGDQWQNGTMPATWLNGKWTEFMIGWQSFSSAANEVWIDDLVLSTSRINCQ